MCVLILYLPTGYTFIVHTVSCRTYISFNIGQCDSFLCVCSIQGADPNAKNHNLQTPLHLAVERQHAQVMRVCDNI